MVSLVQVNVKYVTQEMHPSIHTEFSFQAFLLSRDFSWKKKIKNLVATLDQGVCNLNKITSFSYFTIS